MKKWTVFFDCHWGGPSPCNIKPEFGVKVFYGGDNHEMKNIPKKKVKKREREYINFLKKCEDTNTKVVAGNHERIAGTLHCKTPHYFIDNKILFIHGDSLSYSGESYYKWRNGKMGKGRFAIMAIKLKNFIKNTGSMKIPGNRIIKAVGLMKFYNCHTIVFGHRHPKRKIDISVISGGVPYRIINCPRGKSVIEI